MKNSPKENMVNCKYCQEDIKQNSKVCHHCGTNQIFFWRWIYNLNLIPLIISITLLILSFLQFNEARNERITAENAKNIALDTKNEIIIIEENIAKDKKDVFEMAQVVAYIAEILPRSTGYGSGMSKNMKMDLSMKLDSLNQILKRYNNEK